MGLFNSKDTAPEPRRGMPSPGSTRRQFKTRFLSQFPDPAFEPLRAELEQSHRRGLGRLRK